MHVRTRSPRNAASGGVCDRPRRWPGCDAQSPASTPALAALAAIPQFAARFVSGGSRARRRTTLVQRTGVRSVKADDAGHVHQSANDPALNNAALNRRLMRAIGWYQRQAEGRPSPCRFSPSCSCYAVEALEVHGTLSGLWLTIRRLLRCRPFGPSGFDPVPEVAVPEVVASEVAVPEVFAQKEM